MMVYDNFYDRILWDVKTYFKSSTRVKRMSNTAVDIPIQQEFLVNKNIHMLPQPHTFWFKPLSLFWFPKMKSLLQDLNLVTVDNILQIATKRLKIMPGEDFQHCFKE